MRQKQTNDLLEQTRGSSQRRDIISIDRFISDTDFSLKVLDVGELAQAGQEQKSGNTGDNGLAFVDSRYITTIFRIYAPEHPLPQELNSQKLEIPQRSAEEIMLSEILRRQYGGLSQDWQEQRNGIDARIQQDNSRYSADTVRFREYVAEFDKKEGKSLDSYMKARNRKQILLKGVGAAYLPQKAVAGVVTDGREGYLLANGSGPGFDARVEELAKHYLPKLTAENRANAIELARTYVIAHEKSHLYQNHKGYDDSLAKERENEKMLMGYFAGKANSSTNSLQKERYNTLAGIAKQRYSEVGKNYGSSGNSSKAGTGYSAN